MKIFLICPVHNLNETEKTVMKKYVESWEEAGHTIHWPPRDTNQDDPTGIRIYADNRTALENADEIHVWLDKDCEESRFYLGMAFALRKKIALLNREAVTRTDGKSFGNVLLWYMINQW